MIRNNAFKIYEEKFVKLGTIISAVKITPKTEPKVLIKKTNPEWESLRWLFFNFIIEIKIGFNADIKTNGTDNKIKLPIELPNNKFKFIKLGRKTG